MRLTILPVLLLSGCLGAQPAGEREAELAGALQGRVLAETRDCVPTGLGGSFSAVDSETLIYDGGDTLWVNRLPGGCPGLTPHSTLIMESSTGQYCRGDRFRELEPGASIPGPMCILGEFSAYRRPR